MFGVIFIPNSFFGAVYEYPVSELQTFFLPQPFARLGEFSLALFTNK
jgi:hypothetical protein